MSNGRFFNSLGYGEGSPNNQSNNLNGSQNTLLGSEAQNNGTDVNSGTPMNSSNPLMNGNGNTMMNGNPMQGMNPISNQQNPMVNGNLMNNGSPTNNNIPANPFANQQNNNIPANPFANQQNNNVINPMNNNPMQEMNSIGNQQNSMVSGSPMDNGNPMSNGNPTNNNIPANPFADQQNNNSTNGNNNSQMNNSTSNQQQMITMNSNTPSFNNSLNGINPLGNPVAPQNNNQSNLSIKPKLKMNLKKILLFGVIILVVITVLLCLVCSKTVTCTQDMESQGAKITTTIKVNYWFNKINKITTTIEFDLSALNDAAKQAYFEVYKNLDDGSDVKITDDSIKVTSVHKPTSEDKEKGSDEISPSELIEDYESSGLVCK